MPDYIFRGSQEEGRNDSINHFMTLTMYEKDENSTLCGVCEWNGNGSLTSGTRPCFIDLIEHNSLTISLSDYACLK